MMRWYVDRNIVPVLMFHSIGDTNDRWTWASMTEGASVFEELLQRLKCSGYSTISLDELYSYMRGKHKLQGKSIVLTFDDGYLDNWVIAAPLLRKYQMKGVVYVSPEFVQPMGSLRPTIQDVYAGRLPREDLNTLGFMNWNELRALDAEGLLEVQSHALTHTWYFENGIVRDIHRPREVNPYPWLCWNSRPQRKPWYLNEDQQAFVPWGMPVFSYGKSIVTRRFFPDEELVSEIVSFVGSQGGAKFFELRNWRQCLSANFRIFDQGFVFPGRVEDDEEYRERIKLELSESKSVLENQLGRPVQYLSWPGGGVNDVAAGLARDVGYISWTLSSWQQKRKKNLPHTDPEGVKRVSGRSKVHWRSRWIAEGGSWWVMQRIRQHQGSIESALLTGFCKVYWLARYLLVRFTTALTK